MSQRVRQSGARVPRGDLKMAKNPTNLRAWLRPNLSTRQGRELERETKGKTKKNGTNEKGLGDEVESRGEDVGVACDKGPGPCASSPDAISTAGVPARLDPPNRRHRCSRSTKDQRDQHRTKVPFLHRPLLIRSTCCRFLGSHLSRRSRRSLLGFQESPLLIPSNCMWSRIRPRT